MSKRTPQHPSSFQDIKPILDAALAAGGGAYRPRNQQGKPSPEAAARFRHRAYSFRRSLQHQIEKEGMSVTSTTTPYDGMVLRIDPNDHTVVLINKPDDVGDLMGLDGKPLKIGAPRNPEPAIGEDPLIERARQQAKELGIEL
jgi:hypothetical protein